ncbi:Branched-chain amino acid aminotransferase 2, chloroplastic [Linum grandiflorum]
MERAALLHPNHHLLSPSSFRPFPAEICTRHLFNPCSSSSLTLKLPSLTALHSVSPFKRDAVASYSYSTETAKVESIDWDNLGFQYTPTDYMYMMKCKRGGNFSNGELQPFGNIQLSPSAGVLNYGQGVFEGLKAYRKEDGNILLFRPQENALRMQTGADRMCMSAPTVEQFLEAVKATVLANKRWVPPPGKGSLYIRPLLMGSGAVLGVAPAPEYTFLIYVSPVGNYFKEGLAPINLIVENELHRATPGGTGGVKTIGNYAAGNTISTPAIKGTILPGITRKSIIDVARSQGFQVEERLVEVEELLTADEVFCTGTAVVVSPVGSITYKGQTNKYGGGGVGAVSRKLYNVLTSIQMGVVEDNMNWTLELS